MIDDWTAQTQSTIINQMVHDTRTVVPLFLTDFVLSAHFYGIEGSRQQSDDLLDVRDLLQMKDRLNHALYIRGGDGPRGKCDTVPEFFNEVISFDGIEVMPVGEIGPLCKGPALAVSYPDLARGKLVPLL